MAKSLGRSSLVYLGHEIDDPDDGPYPYLIPCAGWRPDIECDLLAFELENAGLPKGWAEDLAKHPAGYYRVTFDTSIETEGDYREITYMIVDGLLSIEPSLRARWAWILNRRVIPVLEKFINLFRPIWCVDFEYGCVGISSDSMYLPKAIVLRYFTPKGYAAWGDNYTRRLIRCQ